MAEAKAAEKARLAAEYKAKEQARVAAQAAKASAAKAPKPSTALGTEGVRQSIVESTGGLGSAASRAARRVTPAPALPLPLPFPCRYPYPYANPNPNPDCIRDPYPEQVAGPNAEQRSAQGGRRVVKAEAQVTLTLTLTPDP